MLSAFMVVMAVTFYYLIGFTLAFFMGNNAMQRVLLAAVFVVTGFTGLVVAVAIYMAVTAYAVTRLVTKWSK